MKSIPKTTIIVPNWNGQETIVDCIDSLLNQSLVSTIIVVENGSIDNSLKIIEESYPEIIILKQKRNLGFAGGVNVGIRYAIDIGFDFIGLFNNDAIADKNWLNSLVTVLEAHKNVGIVTSKILDYQGKHIDSTGDFYTSWGLPYPRGRGELLSDKYDLDNFVFAGSGGASLYRSSMLKQIRLFDESFFAYYEDVDISFRAQLFGWKVLYQPDALVYHHIGATSKTIKGFTTYQTMKNLPLLLWKNMPSSLLIKIMPRFLIVYLSFFISAAIRKQLQFALKGFFKMLLLLPRASIQRIYILKHKVVPDSYIKSTLIYDLPPNATKIRRLRSIYWSILRKKHV